MSGLAELLGETPKEEEDYFQSGGEKAPPDPEPEAKPDPEAEPPAEKEPPPSEPKEGEGEGEDLEPAADENRRVPLAALREERERRKELTAKIDQQAAMMARLEGRFQQLLTPPPSQEQQQRAPTPDEDPIAVLRNLQQQHDQRTSWEQSQAARAQFEQAVASREAEFMKRTPDYADAAAFLQQRRAADLEAMGVSDPRQRAQVLYQEAAGMAMNAMQANKNPAEVAYGLARSWGYQPKGQQQQPGADQRIEMAQRAQAASGSLSAGGGRSTAPPSLDAIDAMSDEEFSKLSDAKWRKAWGA
jgi:hypothetical protein